VLKSVGTKEYSLDKKILLPKFISLLTFVEEDCRTWNLTLWAGNMNSYEPNPTDLLFTFCPKEGRNEVQVPDTVQNGFIR
jgi:hypothetical protein